jgi:hypothetical protein
LWSGLEPRHIRELLGVDILAPADHLAILERPDVSELGAQTPAGRLVGADVVAEADDRISGVEQLVQLAVEPLKAPRSRAPFSRSLQLGPVRHGFSSPMACMLR